MLNCYGIKLSHSLQEKILSHVVLPGNDVPSTAQNYQRTPKIPSFSSRITVFLTQSATLQNLSALLNELKSFLEPILNKIDVFVYFTLQNCEVFDRYLKSQVATISASSTHITVDHSDISVAEKCACDHEFDKNIMQVNLHLYAVCKHVIVFFCIVCLNFSTKLNPFKRTTNLVLQNILLLSKVPVRSTEQHDW